MLLLPCIYQGNLTPQKNMRPLYVYILVVQSQTSQERACKRQMIRGIIIGWHCAV